MDLYQYLTPREREVLVLIAQGKSNDQIACELVISSATAKNHVHHVLTKLQLENRTQAAAFAFRRGLMDAE